MAKFRSLTLEELEPLEKEFVEFLVINGIPADDWVRIKEEQPDKSVQVIDSFSDVVLDSIMRKTRFLDHWSKTALRAFQYLQDKMVLVALETTDETLNLADPYFFQSENVPLEHLEIYTLEKKYAKQREIELFEMTQQGCEISDGQLFKKLSLLLAEK